MQTKDLRSWQMISVFAAALNLYPARIYQIQDAYDLFDVRDATPDDRKSKFATASRKMWRLKDGAVAADVEAAHAAMLEAGGPQSLAASKTRGKPRKPSAGSASKSPKPPVSVPAPAPQHRHTPEKVEAPKPPEPLPLWKQLGARPKPTAAVVKVRVTHAVEALPFEVSSPEELAQALLALARAVYPDTKTLSLHLAGVTYDAGSK